MGSGAGFLSGGGAGSEKKDGGTRLLFAHVGQGHELQSMEDPYIGRLEWTTEIEWILNGFTPSPTPYRSTAGRMPGIPTPGLGDGA